MKNTYGGLLPITCLLALLSLACPLSKSENPVRPIGPDVNADLLIYFTAGVSQEEINIFDKSVLSRPHPEGQGDYLAPGVRTFLRIPAVEGHEGIAITFFPNATREQREELMKSIRASPLVYKILENTAPDNAKTFK